MLLVPFLSIRTTFIFFRDRVINIFHWDPGPLKWMCSTSPCCPQQSCFLPFHSTLSPLWQEKNPHLVKSISYFPEEEEDACGKLLVMCCINMKYNMSHFCLLLTSLTHFTALNLSGLVLLCAISNMCKVLLSLLSSAYWCFHIAVPAHVTSDMTTLYLSMCVIERTKKERIESLSMANLLAAFKICDRSHTDLELIVPLEKDRGLPFGWFSLIGTVPLGSLAQVI